MMEDITGVNGPLQGKADYSGQSNAMYVQQTANAQTSILDLTESYAGFLTEAAYKDAKNIQQYYDDRMIVNIAGDKAADIQEIHDRLHDIEFDMDIIQSTSSQAYRAIGNQFLLQVWQSGQITLEQMLENGDISGIITVSGLNDISLLIYDNGTPDGGFIFFPDGDGFNSVYQMIQQNYALKSEVPQNTSDLTNDSGYLTLGTLPIWNGSIT